jgi:hypothetical protein
MIIFVEKFQCSSHFHQVGINWLYWLQPLWAKTRNVINSNKWTLPINWYLLNLLHLLLSSRRWKVHHRRARLQLVHRVNLEILLRIYRSILHLIVLGDGRSVVDLNLWSASTMM